jgi:hypothetical protein
MISADLGPSGVADAVVPAGKQWIITHLVGVCDGSASQGVLGIYAPSGHTVAVGIQPAGSNAVYAVETRIVLLAGEDLHVQAVSGTWHVTITGYEFNA